MVLYDFPRDVIMATNPSVTDWIEARASLPRLLSEVAFGDSPCREVAAKAAEALAVPAPAWRRRSIGAS